MKAATAWRLCAVIGVPALAVSRMIGQSAGLEACGHPGGLEPVLAFEFVRNAGDAGAVLLTDACRTGQATALALDNFLFVPLYGLFVIAAAWAAGLGSIAGRRIALAAIAAILIAAASDLTENATLAAILDGGGDFDRLFWAVRVKFALIAIGEMLVGLLLARHGLVLRFAGYMVIAAGGAALVTLLLGVPLAMMKPIAFALILMLCVAIAVSIRPALAERPDPA